MKWHGKELKINVELIPLKMHKVNLRSELPEYWDFLRKLIYKRAIIGVKYVEGKGLNGLLRPMNFGNMMKLME